MCFRNTRRSSCLRAAAAELDHLPAAGGPIGDPAVEHRAGRHAFRGQDRGGDAGAGAALANRHYRPVGGDVGAADREQAIRDVAAPRDVAVVALVALANVDQLDAILEQAGELVEVDRLDALEPPPST